MLDAGCGSGRALIAMAERFPNSRFTGYDLCADAIASAQRSADDAIRELGSSRSGLTSAEAEARLASYGPNAPPGAPGCRYADTQITDLQAYAR